MASIYKELEKFENSINQTKVNDMYELAEKVNLIHKALNKQLTKKEIEDIIVFAHNCKEFLKIDDIRMQITLYYIIFKMRKFYEVDDIDLFISKYKKQQKYDYFKLLNQFKTNNKSLIDMVYSKLF